MALIHHYIPCERIADGVAGFYDICWDLFHVSSGTDPFISGSADLNNTHDLPVEYQELQWVSSSGTQYLDCGYLPLETTIVRCTFEVINPIGTAYNALYGANATAGTIPCIGGLIRPSQATYNVLYQYGNTTTGNYTVNLSGKHTLEQHMNINMYDGVTLGTYAESTFTIPYVMYAFAKNDHGEGPTSFSAIKMYELMIAEDDIPPAPTPTLKLYYNGQAVSDLVYNGQQVDHLVYNGFPVE